MTVRTLCADRDCPRADAFVSEKLPELTRSHVKKLAEEGNVRRGGAPIKASAAVRRGDEIEVLLPDPVPLEVLPEDIPLDIVYEDEDIAVVNKQRGLAVHAGSGRKDGTLVNALLARLDRLSGINGVLRPGIVHRIDKDTTGLLVVAKNDAAHLSLAGQIANKTCRRVYYALLEGRVKDDRGTIETKIARSKADRKKMAVSDEGRTAITDYEVVERFPAYTFCRFSLRTGRTHQIRVHAKYLGHPVVGDPLYGYKKQRFSLDGQLLHAGELTFLHPRTGEEVTFTAPLPEDFRKVLDALRREKPTFPSVFDGIF